MKEDKPKKNTIKMGQISRPNQSFFFATRTLLALLDGLVLTVFIVADDTVLVEDRLVDFEDLQDFLIARGLIDDTRNHRRNCYKQKPPITSVFLAVFFCQKKRKVFKMKEDILRLSDGS
jgi:hypothetical protein